MHYPRSGCEGVAGGETTAALKGTTMKSTMVLSTDISRRTPRVDMGWPACDERLVTSAEAKWALSRRCHDQLPDVRYAGGIDVASHGR